MYITDKRTKLVATIGPSSDNHEMLKKLVQAGVTTVRANFSHGDYAEQGRKFELARQISKELNIPVSTMLDTKGPEIRVGKMKDGIQTIKAGSKIKILTMPEDYKNKEGDETFFTVEYRMDKDLKAGNKVLVDDGKLTTVVDKVEEGVVYVTAMNTHKVKSNKRINLPGVAFSLPFLSDKDRADVKFGIEQKVSYIAASFVNTKENVLELRKLLDDNGGEKIRIISKIESQLGCDNLDEIIEASDGIMVARGDLGLEIPYYEVPFWEKRMIRQSRNVGKPVIVATQMLDSMENNPQPTRAEVTDVYFATELGADSTMLSGESANGSYPLEAVTVMSTISRRAEKEFYNKLFYAHHLEEISKVSPRDVRTKIARHVAEATADGRYRFVVVLSDTGKLLERIAMYRPNAAIIGMLKDEGLIYSYGVTSSVFVSLDSTKLYNLVRDDYNLVVQALRSYGIKSGEKVLVAHNEELTEIVAP